MAAEYPFEVPIVNPGTGAQLDVPIQGIMDVIEEGDSIGEFKTAARSMDRPTLLNNLQLTVYAYAYQWMFKKEVKKLKVINFIKNKNPKMEVLETNRSQKDFTRLFYLGRGVSWIR